MLDPPADVDLELTLFETITVVPGLYEEKWLDHMMQGQYIEAKMLTVNLDLRAWLGKSNRAEREGYETRRLVTVERKRRKPGERLVALFKYETKPERGLRLDLPEDQSRSNFG
ncbi:MAG: hypothetical protein M3347_00285 [Armatimonadota bacterium]|nr:hypothetical protein [Armatimonadota bacterium]